MPSKQKSASKIPTTGKNTNKKKYEQESVKKIDTAFFKKNEFALILLGALLLTVIIFFVFFRSPEKSESPVAAREPASSYDTLEKRISALEKAGTMEGKTIALDDKENAAGMGELANRVTQLETVSLVKFDSLVERLESLEKKIAQLKTAPVKPKPAVKAPVKKSPPVAKVPVKKAVKKEKKASIFHTVTKGETLYSISKKYKTTVPALKKLNNLSEKDKIFPGNNIIVR